MPTTENRVPNTITVTINGTQVELPGRLASISVISTTVDEFSTILRGLLTVPGAELPTTAAGVSAVVHIGDVSVSVLAPAVIRDARPSSSLSPELDAAIADAVNVTEHAA